MGKLCLCDLIFQARRSGTASNETDSLPVWFASAGCSAATASSFPAPRWKCTLPSVAGWQPLGRKENNVLKSLPFVRKAKKRLILSHRLNLPETHLAELLSVTVWDESFKWLESSIDALHTPTLIAVGDLSTNSPLLVPGCFWGQRNVGQTRGEYV